MSERHFVLDPLVDYVRRFVVLAAAQADALALWSAHTHVFEVFDCSPYLAIGSAVKRCGKTRAVEVLELVVARPWRIVRPSEAVLYRKVARDRPTLLLDEADAIFRHDGEVEPLRAILDAGNRAGVRVPRCAGPQRDRLEEFDVYCPKVLAGIGRLPETISDRAILITLKRRTKGEPVERFRRRDEEAGASQLRDLTADWIEPNADYLSRLRPELPVELDDRAADGWEPLLAIAELAGGDWPARARHAALELAGTADVDEDSLGVRLLADVRRVFDERGVDRLSTAELLAGLTDDLEAPWATLGRGERPLVPGRLAKLLRPFGVRSRTIWLGDDTTAKGYPRDVFEDAWERYAPASPGSEPSGRQTPHQQRARGDFAAVRPDGNERGAIPHGERDLTALRLGVQTSGSATFADVDEDEVERLAERVRDVQRDDINDAGKTPEKEDE